MASLIQWNIHGLRANYNELVILMQCFQPVAFCIQELKIPNFYQFCTIHCSLVSKLPDVDNSNTPTGGSGILIRKDILATAGSSLLHIYT
jgi:exonuclease III